MITYATAGDLARIYNVSLPTIRRWAGEDHWRRTTTRPRGYSRADAQASWDKRHGARSHQRLLAALTS